MFYMYCPCASRFSHERDFFFLSVIFFFLSVIFFAKHGTSMKSHATNAARARNKRGSSVEVAWILRGFGVGFAWVLRGT